MTESHYPPKSPIEGDDPVQGATLADQAMMGAPPPRKRRSGGGSRTGLMVALSVLAGLVICGGILAIVIASNNVGNSIEDDVNDQIDQALDDTREGLSGFPEATEAPEFATGDPTAMAELTTEGLAALEEQLGAPPRLLSFALYDDGYWVAEVQLPDSPQDVDRYTYYYDRGLLEPDPVQSSSLPDDLESELFDAAAVSGDVVPTLLAQAQQAMEGATTIELQPPGGQLNYLVVSSGQPFDERILARAFFAGDERHSGGWVELTLAGEVVEVSPPA